MAQPGISMASSAFAVSNARRTLPRSQVLSDVCKTLKGLFDPYRPELHYMRGPGPKWLAKHGSSHTKRFDCGAGETYSH